jgi:hypothetical protein
MKEILQETKNLTDIEKQILHLLKKYVLSKISFYLSQDEQHIFYIPSKNEIILSKPFPDERKLFHLLIEIEAFIIEHNIKDITIVTTEKSAILTHPFADVRLIPFDAWASKF